MKPELAEQLHNIVVRLKDLTEKRNRWLHANWSDANDDDPALILSFGGGSNAGRIKTEHVSVDEIGAATSEISVVIVQLTVLVQAMSGAPEEVFLEEPKEIDVFE